MSSASDLQKKSCVPCEGGASPLSEKEARSLLTDLPGWVLETKDDHLLITKIFTCSNFLEAMSFANTLTEIVEAENHHPDLSLSWGKCTVTLWTHSINGLSENDFIVAAKIDALQI
jgi:4a-hydroxytetrahydrobiopterin dehydratase